MRIHIVQKGDTLWQIANKYNVDLEVLKQMNAHLSDPDVLMPGMKIQLPAEMQKKEQWKQAPKEHMKKDMDYPEMGKKKEDIPPPPEMPMPTIDQQMQDYYKKHHCPPPVKGEPQAFICYPIPLPKEHKHYPDKPPCYPYPRPRR
ncbi:SafA/ExsA family spore coat assembly protein [Salimicrobium halophilum]|uniref:Spore coat assembly protein SafA n=1 Tax=Salimicrobium halophilum TaxID=86666 RepID=A0A1G8PKI6_9BACI|nr:SafA/ExsA family spore coat assembly protein [Salimicrobium halophilum]SDI92957.1 spore coat assembly protein SafA [Salimicrobium halophilum]